MELFEKSELTNKTIDELKEIHIYMGVLSKLENLIKKGTTEKWKATKKQVFGESNIASLKDHIKTYEVTNKNENILLSVILMDEQNKANIDKLYEENTSEITSALDLLYRTDFFKDCLQNDNAVYFKQLIQEAILSLTAEATSMSKIKPYEREVYFQSLAQNKVQILSNYIVIQSKIGRIQNLKNDILLKKNENLEIFESLRIKKDQIKENYKAKGLKRSISNFFKSNKKKKEEYQEDYLVAIEAIEQVLYCIMDVILNIMLVNISLNKEDKLISFENNMELSKRVFNYVSSLSINFVERITIEMDAGDVQEIKEKDDALVKKLYIGNIIKIQNKLSIKEENELLELME